jgi:hypothetical protein
MMSKDISEILNDWPYDPESPTIRIIRGSDGRDVVQMRVDLGLLQMAMDGRPDGLRPEGRESWLEYYQRQQETHDTAHPDSAPFRLDDKACQRLWAECIQYYHRYISFWHLQRHDLCARDTRRNLDLFAFVREHGPNDRAKLQFDQWRPYVLMMHARSAATPLVETGQIAQALLLVEVAIDEILEFLDHYDQSERADECAELVDLKRWREHLLTQLGPGEALEETAAVAELRRRLQEAIEAEEFEEAAQLRDEIRRLMGQR